MRARLCSTRRGSPRAPYLERCCVRSNTMECHNVIKIIETRVQERCLAQRSVREGFTFDFCCFFSFSNDRESFRNGAEGIRAVRLHDKILSRVRFASCFILSSSRRPSLSLAQRPAATRRAINTQPYRHPQVRPTIALDWKNEASKSEWREKKEKKKKCANACSRIRRRKEQETQNKDSLLCRDETRDAGPCGRNASQTGFLSSSHLHAH